MKCPSCKRGSLETLKRSTKYGIKEYPILVCNSCGTGFSGEEKPLAVNKKRRR